LRADCGANAPFSWPEVIPNSEFGEVVAESEFLFQWANGDEKPVRLKVGRPYLEDGMNWACACEIEGFEARYPDARGEDSYQALFLAQYLMKHRLRDFLAKGGRIFIGEEREELSREDLDRFFGT
jgi:hypothetical protein